MKSKKTNGSNGAEPKGKKVNPRQALFVKFYVASLNAAQSCRNAGYSANSAYITSSKLLKNPLVQAEIQRHANKVASRLELDAATVIEKLWHIAATDVNELIQVKIGACRHCHGTNFDYMETPHERRVRRREYDKNLPHWQRVADKGVEPVPDFDERGGVGYNRTLPPRADCPECNGVGSNYIVMADTSTLSPAAKALYMGARETANGIELKIAPRDKALELLGQHFGLWKTAAPLAPPTYQQNNLYALSTEQLYEIVTGRRQGGAQGSGGGNPAPAISEG